MITTSARSRVEGCERSQRSTPRNVTSGPYIPPRRDTIRRPLRPEVLRHRGEVVDVALDVVDRVLDGKRPVFLRSWRHHDPTVALVEPAQVSQRLVDLQVIAVVADPLRAVSDAAARGERDHVKRQLALTDDFVKAALERLRESVEV